MQTIGFIGRYRFLDAEDELFPTSDRDEDRVELELNYLNPRGLGLGLRHTYRNLNFDNRPDDETVNTSQSHSTEPGACRYAWRLYVDLDAAHGAGQLQYRAQGRHQGAG